MLFDGWMTLGRTALVGTLAYLALVLLLRVSGKRTLSKMNAFDFVVTVALGSTLATVLLSSSVSLVRGILAFAVLISLQFIITWLSARSPAFRRLIKAEPTLLVHKGEFLTGAMKQERVTEEEVRAAMRSQGISAVEEVEAVVLETTSDLSVVVQPSGESASSLADVSDQRG